MRRIVNEVAAEHGFDNETLMADRQSKVRLNAKELAARDAGEYVWKDDLTGRLDTAMSGSTTRDEFKDAAEAEGVEVRYTGKTGASYAFTDKDDKAQSIRARALGSQWMAKGLDVQLEANRLLEQERQRLDAEEREKTKREAQEALEREQVEKARQAEVEAAQAAEQARIRAAEESWDFEVEIPSNKTPRAAQVAAADEWDFEVALPEKKTRTRSVFAERESKSNDYGMEL